MLVSPIYRQIPSPSYHPNPDEAERRLRVAMRRLIALYGADEVIRRIRAYPVKAREKGTQGWLVLTADAERNRQQDGTG